MMNKINIFVWFFVFISITCGNRFSREELGLPDRPRFTCGHLHYYNCTVVNDELISNFKIGMYLYGKKVQVQYSLNDTLNYYLQSYLLEDFYFAVVKVKHKNTRQNVLLTARDALTDKFLDSALLKTKFIEKVNSAPSFLNSSRTVINVYDDTFVGTSVGRLVVEKTIHPMFSIDKDDLLHLEEFSLMADGRILLTKKINAKLNNYVKFTVHVFSFGHKFTNSLTVEINILPAKKHKNISTAYCQNQYIKSLSNKSDQKYTPLNIPTAFNFSFSELAPSSTILGSLMFDTYGKFSFDIVSDVVDQKFAIGRYSGVLSILDNSGIDYENQKYYHLIVKTEDQAKLKKSFIHIYLHVLDANDNPPVFLKDKYSVNVSESSLIGTTILQVSATDQDEIDQGKIYFTFANDLPVPFSVNFNGSIQVSESLDLLTKNNVYYLYVKAIDSGGLIRLETVAVVEVYIVPVNSHQPIMMQSKCEVFFTFHSTPSALITFKAVDQDIEDKFTFHLEPNNVLFYLNESSGILNLTQNIRIDNAKDTVLYVKASDGVHMSEPCEIRVKFKSSTQEVVRCNENVFYTQILPKIKAKKIQINPTEKPKTSPRPAFGSVSFISQPNHVLRISEDMAVNIPVAKYFAADSDKTCFGIVMYTIIDGNAVGKFQIDTFNGTLYLINPLDREKINSFSLTIQANDIHGHSVITTTRIEVQDINDNAPVFTRNGNYEVNFILNANKTVVNVHATDLDEGKNGQITYSLVNPSKLFTLNAETGELRYVSSLDDLPYTEYFIDVKASDNGQEKSFQSFALVHIKTTDKKNQNPLCLTDKQRIEVPVNTPVGTIVGRVFGYDEDANIGQELKYYVIDTSEMTQFNAYFTLYSDSGLIKLKRSLSQKDKGFVFNIAVQIGDGKLITKCHVYKIIVDAYSVNQLVFLNNKYPNRVEIPSTAPKKSFVMEIQAQLKDSSSAASIQYGLVDGSGINIFSVDQLFGSVYIKSTDFKKSFYWLTIQAYLAKDPLVFVNTHVLVHIKGTEIRQKFLNPSVYHVHVFTDNNHDRFITQLFSTNGQGRYNDDDSKYSIHAGDPFQLFTIRDDKIYSQKILNIGVYKLNVTVSSNSNSTLISHGYVVIDVTDNISKPPKFPNNDASGIANINVFETQGIMKPPFLFQAFAKSNNKPEEVLTYTIDQPFTIDSRTAAINAGDLFAGEMHYIEVKAVNKLKQKASMYLGINVIAKPKKKTELSFKKSSYTFNVDENTENIYLMEFSEEIQHSSNSPVFYYIISGNEYFNFYIGPGLSSLIILKALDYEQAPTHSLQILAFDGQTFAHTQLKVEVTNLNDNALTVSQPCYEGRILENTRSTASLITIEVTDPDRIESEFNYIMINDVQGQSPFAVSKRGVISVKPSLTFDREIQQEHVVTVVGGSKQDNATYCVKVIIDDMNDHAPNFTKSVYEIQIYDSTAVTTPVMAVYATDEDTGPNAELTFTLISKNEFFELDKAGVLTVKKELYSLSQKLIVLDVKVSDNGDPPFSSFCQIKLLIIADLQKLKFNQGSYEFEVEENAPYATLISQATQINVSSLSYEIEPANDVCYEMFWIDSITGVLLTKVPFDYEEIQNCSFTVTASLHEKVVASTYVFVKINDVNDNLPVFVQQSYFGTIVEGKNSNSKVLTLDGQRLKVTANDKDDGANGQITYLFVENNLKMYFDINPETGEILSNMVLDYEKHPSMFEFHVQALDHGNPQYSAIVPVTIKMININDRIPNFNKIDIIPVQLPIYKGLEVYQLTAFDDDRLANTMLVFDMYDPNDVFSVYPDTGIIFVKNPSNLIRKQDFISIKAAVSDGMFQRETPVQLQLTTYTNSSTFYFVPNSITGTIVENVMTEQVVAVLNPIGYSMGEALTFRILNPTTKFMINPISGVITTNSSALFDREEKGFYEIHVEVVKKESPSFVARIFINLDVEDVNDNSPVFLKNEYYQAMDIDTPGGALITTVSAVDADLGENGRVRYKLLTGTENFDCEESSGIIYLHKSLKKTQASPKYSITVQAYDNGTNMLSAEVDIKIPIINKDQPVFSENYKFKVQEDAWFGIDVGTIKAKGRDNRLVYYSISDGDLYSQFDIGFSTGGLIVAGTLNCSRQYIYRLTIRAIDSLTGSWSETDCEVTVEDVNDNIPLFEKSSYKVNVSEDLQKGSVIIVLTAFDHDFDINAKLFYTLTESESSPYFSIDKNSCVVTLLTTLDAEESSEHLLYVTVSDQGTPKQKSFTTVLVNVMDVNDNVPEFLDETYMFYVDTYDGSGRQFIGRVQAFDRDRTDELVYSMVDIQENLLIDQKNGIIYLLYNADPLTILDVKVSVSDGLHSAFATVKVKFNARNEYPPATDKSISASILEGSGLESEIISLNVLDLDREKYGKLTYQIDSQCCEGEYFTVDNNGTLRTNGVLFDREKQAHFVVTIRATDGGGLFALSTVYIDIIDVNDHAPVFEFSRYLTNIKTSQLSADSLLHVIAIDLDAGINAELKYSSEINVQNVPIKLNESTGLVSLAGSPKGARYQFFVQATDNGFPLRTSSPSYVQIGVKGWSDQLLKFKNHTYHVSVDENAAIDTVIATVEIDRSHFNGSVRYSLIDGNLLYTKSSMFFKINSKNGQILLSQLLDYESIKTHKLMVHVTNEGNGKETKAMCFVYFYVQNVNDNSPKLYSATYDIKIAENIGVGQQIIKIGGVDLDDPTGESLRYLLYSSGQDYFTIHPRTGWVKISKELDREIIPVHKLTVKVEDENGRSDNAQLIIHLVDVNDSPPQFIQAEYTFYVNQDILMGQEIGVVMATDPDDDNTISYFTETNACDKNFAIDSKTGSIRVLQKPSKEEYTLEVVAFDRVHISRSTVKIKRNNVNHYYPYCVHSYYKFSVLEDTKPTTPLAKIEATDQDFGDELKFTVQGDGMVKFKVDEKTGLLSTIDKLDRETWMQYNFKVVVTDKASHTCESDVFITVDDVNDNTPTFAQSLYIATVRENATESTVITRVNAIDNDLLMNKVVNYELLNYPNQIFTIDKNGIIILSKAHLINRNAISNYSLIVKAYDSGKPMLESLTKLQLIVLSVLDTPPQFGKLTYTFSVEENRPEGTVIGKIQVKTTTTLSGKTVLMKISNDPNKVFSLSKDGELKVQKQLDFETKTSYRFNIKVWFERIPSLSSMASIEIKILDTNDHTPTFSQGSYFKQIDENVRPGTFVVRAYATDNDGTAANSLITYRLISTESLPFIINSLTGEITVNNAIDHEMNSTYFFYVSAEDNGEPKHSTNVPVTVNITDLNDNAPIISEYNTTMIVQEGTSPGSTLLKLGVTDRDSPKNGAPFTCTMYIGSSIKFVVSTENGNTCIVRSKELFKVQENTQYELTIRVTDSGTPKRYCDSQVRIFVVKESYYPPVIQGSKMFFVIVSRPHGVTKIGEVKVFDTDVNSIHQFKIIGGNQHGYFSIQPMTGVIEGRPKKGIYTLSVEVSDGKYTDSGLYKVVVNEIDNNVKVRSTPMFISGITAKDFVQEKMHRFVDVLDNLLGRDPEDVFIWSIQDVADTTIRLKRRAISSKILIAVVVWDPLEANFMTPSVVKEYVMNSKDQFKDIELDVNIPNIECVSEQCPNNMYCALTLTPKEEISIAYMPSGYMTFTRDEKCYCKDGSEGPFCYSHTECTPNSCKKGEKCIPNSVGFECQDEKSILPGNDAITLDGRSYVSYVLRKDFDKLFNSLSFRFRTETNSGILFYAEGKDFFIVEIENGYLKARFNFGSGVGSLLVDKKLTNDGNWHHVDIGRLQNFVSLSLDYNDYRTDGRAPGDSANININYNTIVFGAGVSKDGSAFSGFSGCIQDIKLNKNLLPYSGADEIVEEVTTRRISFGCKDSNLCTETHCPKFSDCINTFTWYICECLPGHTGSSCSSELTCSDNPCKNGGTCTYELVNSKINYKCTCRYGFTGAQCHIDLKACKQYPCLNGGKCSSVTDTEYLCDCPTGYSGKNCEFVVNPCSSNPCYYSARCVNLANDYKCECSYVGKRGKQCIAGEYCNHMQCKNSGVCSELLDGGQCVCKPGFTGVLCGEDVDECLNGPCESGTCINTRGSYYCNCTDGKVDLKCAVPVTLEESGIPLVLIAGGAGGGGVLIIIVLVVVSIWCIKRHRRQAHLQENTNSYERKMYPLDRYDDYELAELYPPNPPPRGFPAPPGYYDESDQASAAMYDPSMVTFSSASSPADKKIKIHPDMSDMDYNSDDGDLRYHWDYSEVPEDVINKKMSREGSRIGLTKTDQYYPEEGFDYVDIPQIPERPASRRSSLPGYPESETDVPELPELPHQVRTSRQSLSSNQSPQSTLPRLPPHLTSSEFQHRYSLLSDEQDNSDFRQPDSSYFHDILEGEDDTVPRTYNKPYHGVNRCGDSDIDACTETSFNSDDDDADENDPLDPENTRQLERDIKKLFKDLQKRTEED